jgi:protein-S-isoprenylcysteine O-methyltransferase Ste14
MAMEELPLPEPHLFFLGAGIVLHLVRPHKITSVRGPHHLVGWLFIVLGGALAVWATRSASNTDLENPDGVVTDGPYAISRHPMYGAWTLIYLGVALVSNAAWLLILLPLLLLLVHRDALREERRPEERFGSAYRPYRGRVRRYL